MLDQCGLANLTGTEQDTHFVASEDIPQRLFRDPLKIHSIRNNLSFCIVQLAISNIDARAPPPA
jgi:hypothetical protein